VRDRERVRNVCVRVRDHECEDGRLCLLRDNVCVRARDRQREREGEIKKDGKREKKTFEF